MKKLMLIICFYVITLNLKAQLPPVKEYIIGKWNVAFLEIGGDKKSKDKTIEFINDSAKYVSKGILKCSSKYLYNEKLNTISFRIFNRGDVYFDIKDAYVILLSGNELEIAGKGISTLDSKEWFFVLRLDKNFNNQ